MSFTTRPEIVGRFGVVATTHWIASQVAMNVLERGGNAFDACAAAAFTLHVVEPHLNGPAGDSVSVLLRAGETQPVCLCGQGVTPQGMTLELFRKHGLPVIPGDGLLPAVVPGSVDAILIMLRDYGSMNFRDAIGPAIEYARDGWPVVQGITDAIASCAERFLTEWKSSAEVYLPGGKPPAGGQLFRSTKLAETYARWLTEAEAAGSDRVNQIEKARDVFYRGFIAEAIERFATKFEAMDASGRRHKGVLTAHDMANWQASFEQPTTISYRGWQVFKSGPWGQGPSLLQHLKLLEGFDIAAMDTEGPDFVHALVEAMKLSYADREAWYGDPKFFDVPMATLLSDTYTAERRKLIGTQASGEFRPGAPDGRQPKLPHYEIGTTATEPTAAERAREAREMHHTAGGAGVRAARGPAEGDTCHIDVIDKWGNTVAMTPSGAWLQSSPVVPELGFCLSMRGQMFWLEDGLATSLKPGARPRTTLTPSLAIGPNGERIAFGTPGGDSQDQWILQFFLRHIDHGKNLQAAIDTPQFQTDHHPNSFYPRKAQPRRVLIEDRFPKETLDELTHRGHTVEKSGGWTLGRNCAARREADGKTLRAGATARRSQAYAVGR